MSATVRWTLAIVGLLGTNVIAMIILAVTAQVAKPQIIPDYYQRAVTYDDAIDEAAASAKLAWHAETSIGGGAIAVDLRDAAGAPIVGARVRVAGYQRAHAAERFDVELSAVGPGRYRIDQAIRIGTHDLDVTAERGTAKFVEHATLEAR